MSPTVEQELSEATGDRGVEAIVLLKVDTAKADDIGEALSTFNQIEHVYLVTGEDDLVLKARFNTYQDLKNFIVRALAPLEGVEDTKTMMVVSTYKENGSIRKS